MVSYGQSSSSKKYAPLLQQIRKQIGSRGIQKLERTVGDLHFFDLSLGQQRLWLLHQMYPDSPFYHMPDALHIQGALHVPALEASLRQIIARHEVLRTSLVSVEGVPMQQVHAHCPWSLRVLDLRTLPASAQQQALSEHERECFLYPFDLSQPPLLRTRLLRLGEEEAVLLLCAHHLIFDGWSWGVFYQELQQGYEAVVQQREAHLPPLECQYADYAAWQREVLQGPHLERLLSYWKEQLEGAPELLELPTDYVRPPQQSYRGGWQRFELTEQESEGVRELARQSGCTTFMVLLAAFALLLSRWSGQSDLVIGLGVAGRQRAEVENLLGFFINSLPLRLRVPGRGTLRAWLEQVRERALGAYAHQELPLEQLVEELQPERSLAYHPLFQVACIEQAESQLPERWAEVRVKRRPVTSSSAKFDLTLFLDTQRAQISGAWEYSTALFSQQSIERLRQMWQQVLRQMCEQPEARVWQVGLVSDPQQEAQRHQGEVRRLEQKGSTVVQAFEEQVRRRPEACALQVLGGEQISYERLNRKVNQVARVLQQWGVGAEQRVGVSLPRSEELVMVVLAILKVGGVYVPVDPSYPEARREQMLVDAQVRVLVEQGRAGEQEEARQMRRVGMEEVRERAEKMSEENVGEQVHARQLAYLIYTSGSTGQPKGVAIEHLSLYNLACAQIQSFVIDQSERVLLYASPSFDASISEIFITLLSGATLCIAGKEHLLPGHAFEQLLLEQHVSCVTYPPVVLATLEPDCCPSLRTIISAGEQCIPELIHRWSTGRRFLNAYGPTEATVCATIAEGQESLPLHAGRNPSIGRAITNIAVYILDDALQLVPAGVPGEIYIGGIGVARGYFRKPDRTAEVFLPDPLSQVPGARLYKTGDRALYLPDGRIEVLGRTDRQIKVRGFRIEPGHIEVVLDAHPTIQKSVVVAHQESPYTTRLIAYLLKYPGSADTGIALSATLRSYLQNYLPSYMLPELYIELESLPTNGSGKIDYAALPPPRAYQPRRTTTYVAARLGLEQKIAHIWKEVLHVTEVCVFA